MEIKVERMKQKTSGGSKSWTKSEFNHTKTDNINIKVFYADNSPISH